jgi:hypothetical protein
MQPVHEFKQTNGRGGRLWKKRNSILATAAVDPKLLTKNSAYFRKYFLTANIARHYVERNGAKRPSKASNAASYVRFHALIKDNHPANDPRMYERHIASCLAVLSHPFASSGNCLPTRDVQSSPHEHQNRHQERNQTRDES